MEWIMADENNVSPAYGSSLTSDEVDDITGYFCRIDNGVSALYLVIEELENFVEMAREKIDGFKVLFL
jgi:hypothetical protein